MNKEHARTDFEDMREPIDEYFECTTYCSTDSQEEDCQTICMERHLKGTYF